MSMSSWRSKLTDRAWIDGFAAGTVGAAYRDFLDGTGYSADGLVELSMAEGAFQGSDVAHPYAWMGRRERDIHDLWHVLTGYKADEHLGEACLVAFSYAQTGGLGWGFIALGAGAQERQGDARDRVPPGRDRRLSPRPARALAPRRGL